MKFLIAVGSEDYSGPTLRVGMEVASAFNASVTVVKVGPKISEYSASQIKLTQERLGEWDFDSPGVVVLGGFRKTCLNHRGGNILILSQKTKRPLQPLHSRTIKIPFTHSFLGKLYVGCRIFTDSGTNFNYSYRCIKG